VSWAGRSFARPTPADGVRAVWDRQSQQDKIGRKGTVAKQALTGPHNAPAFAVRARNRQGAINPCSRERKNTTWTCQRWRMKPW
jgi:hypothetical protein